MINSVNADSFFSSLDAMIASPRAPKVAAPKKAIRKVAKEEVTKNSTQDEFIAQFVEAVGSFILNSRDAFDVEDATALNEFVGVLEVEEVQNRILDYLANPPADEEEIVENVPDQSEAPEEDNLVLDDEVEDDAPAALASGDDSDYVSDDVMKLLDEE